MISLEKLRKNYFPFEAKRKLCQSYDLFLADRAVVTRLPQLLGKEFFSRKKCVARCVLSALARPTC